MRRNRKKRRREEAEQATAYGHLNNQSISLIMLAIVILIFFIFPQSPGIKQLLGITDGGTVDIILPPDIKPPPPPVQPDIPDDGPGGAELLLPSEQTVMLLEQSGFVDLRTYGAEPGRSNGLLFEMRYSAGDNFTGAPLYETEACFVLRETADKLLAANEEFMDMGYRLKVFDAYRPWSVQVLLYNAVDPALRMYIADPAGGSMHNRGAAVDVTLTDMEGNELEMPTGFDFFGPEAHNDYAGGSELSRQNRKLLRDVMERHGLTNTRIEWWHFDDLAVRRAPIVDTPI